MSRVSIAAARRAPRLAMLLAVAVALLSPRAFAAVSPMCDPSGASMIAPIPVLPNATGELVAPKSCDDAARYSVEAGTSQKEAPSLERGVQPPERLVAAAFTVCSQRGVLVPLAEPPSDDLPTAHSAPVYRPPRG